MLDQEYPTISLQYEAEYSLHCMDSEELDELLNLPWDTVDYQIEVSGLTFFVYMEDEYTTLDCSTVSQAIDDLDTYIPDEIELFGETFYLENYNVTGTEEY